MTDYTIDSVEGALGLLLLVAKTPGLGVTELAQRSGNTKARAFRMLFTLEKNGLLFRDGYTPTYSLGYNALYLGVAAEGQISLARLAKNYLREVGIACNENVQIRIRDGIESVCIGRWESTHHIRVQTELGNRRPLYAGASGKILLAFAPDEIREYILNTERMRYTGATLVSRSSLKQSINKILRTGYTVSYGEMSIDAVAIAAPVFNANAEVIAAISIAGPASRIKESEIEGMAKLVVKAAHELSLNLGYR
jgi:IclR family transcriptional regulator, KDG regulon repressor